MNSNQGQSYLPEKQSSLEDRYYNNQSFQDEYPVNDPQVNNAATKIQANFRGHKARQNVEKIKQDQKQMVDTDQQELGYRNEQRETPFQDETQVSQDQSQQQTPAPSAPPAEEPDYSKVEQEPDEQFQEELTEEEKEEQERAARSIQARFRGLQLRKSAGRERQSPDQPSSRQQTQESDNEKTSSRSSTHFSTKLDSDRQDLGGNLTSNDQIETGEDIDTDRPGLQREPTQLSEDFERHIQAPRDTDLDRDEQQTDYNNEEDDMNDPSLDKAATRIQASYRGYKTRKELGNTTTSDQQQNPSTTSPHPHDDDENNIQNKSLSPTGEGQKEAEGEDDDNAAAVKIQAAYRGYRARKELEK